jgi:DNA-directed RNA polymerase omega subunit
VTKKKEEAPSVPKDSLSLSQLMLDRTHDKYRLVAMATRWAHEIKVRDQETLPPQALMDKALREILTEKVSFEDIEKLPPPPKQERKPADVILLKDAADKPAAPIPLVGESVEETGKKTTGKTAKDAEAGAADAEEETEDDAEPSDADLKGADAPEAE